MERKRKGFLGKFFDGAASKDVDCEALSSRQAVPLIGKRTLKTVLAVFLAAVVMKYVFHQTPFFACIGAVVAVEKTLSQSLRATVVRNIGTLTGGLTGIVVSWLTHNIFFISLGLIPMIYVDNLIRRQDSIVVGSIVYFAVVYLNMSGGALAYGLTRILCTFAGTMIGLAVNRFVFPPAVES